jgi:HK97 family phage prohead protease
MTETELVIARTYDAAGLEVGDGRTILGRLVPYGVPATVADVDGVPYREQHAPGAYARAARAAHRFLLNYEHREGVLDQLARGVRLDDRPDGLYGEFRAFDGAVGDQALELIRSGAAVGLSVQARIPPRSSRTLADGTIERTRAVLEHVALTSEPSYEGAGVLALRSGVRHPALEAVRAWRPDLETVRAHRPISGV